MCVNSPFVKRQPAFRPSTQKEQQKVFLLLLYLLFILFGLHDQTLLNSGQRVDHAFLTGLGNFIQVISVIGFQGLINPNHPAFLVGGLRFRNGIDGEVGIVRHLGIAGGGILGDLQIQNDGIVGSRPVWAGPASAASGGFSAAGPGAAVADFERLFREEGSGYRKRATKAERTKKPNQHHK